MRLRTAVLLVAIAGIPLALLVLGLPITWGYGGYSYARASGEKANVYFLDPDGPAARAGVRMGDVIQVPKGYDAVLENAGPAGTTARVHVVRKDGVHVINVTFVRFFGPLATQEVVSKVVASLTALFAFAVAILVALRAREARVGSRAAAVLVLSGVVALCTGGAVVCGNAWAALLLTRAFPELFGVLTAWSILWLLAIYPPNATRLRRLLATLFLIPVAWTVLSIWANMAAIVTGQQVPLFGFLASKQTSVLVVPLLFLLIPVAAIVHGMITADDAHKTPMRWLGGMWLASIAMVALPNVAALAGSTILFTHYGDALNAVSLFFLAFGVGYPVLRHRLVDLNILVTRATIFGTVSAIIVGVFIAAEWAIGKIFEQSVGLSNDRRGVAAQLVTLAVVLVLGISARSIHKFVEDRLTKTFFRKRMNGLADIQRVAHEADAATDAQALMQLAVTTIQHALEPVGCAFYLREGNAYERRAVAGELLFQPAYEFNDGPPLRLRRWQEPFEIDDESDDRHHMLFVPMTVRGDLVGFLCCGPKPDRTLYLADEIAALSTLAHHTGIASAWLGRMPAPPMKLIPT